MWWEGIEALGRVEVGTILPRQGLCRRRRGREASSSSWDVAERGEYGVLREGCWGLGFGVWGLGFGVWGLGFLVLVFGFV